MINFPPKFIEDWAKQFDCEPNEWAIVECLVNVSKNYDTACGLMAQLSWKNTTHRSYLERMSAALKTYVAQYPDTTFVAADLHTWLTWYTTDVEELPQ